MDMNVCAFEAQQSPIASRNEKSCRALYVCDCEGCSFYKTEEEAADGRRRAALRIMSLDLAQRNRLVDKYYRIKNRGMRDEEI